MIVAYRRALIPIAFAFASIASANPFPTEKYIAKMMIESPPADDGLIVPGWRIGKVHLGMTAQALLEAMGAPATSTSFGIEGGSHYRWETPLGCLQAEEYKGRVARARTCDESSGFHLSGGGRVGASDLPIKAQLGPPKSSKPFESDSRTAYCYDQGLWHTSSAAGATVSQLVVQKQGDLWPCKS